MYYNNFVTFLHILAFKHKPQNTLKFELHIVSRHALSIMQALAALCTSCVLFLLATVPISLAIKVYSRNIATLTLHNNY